MTNQEIFDEMYWEAKINPPAPPMAINRVPYYLVQGYLTKTQARKAAAAARKCRYNTHIHDLKRIRGILKGSIGLKNYGLFLHPKGD